MVKYKLRLFFGISLFFGLSLVFLGAEGFDGSGVTLNIRYFDKRIYHLETDPVMIQLTITNNGTAPFRFKMAEERAFSVDFDVRTTTNRALEAADTLQRKRSSSRQIYFREVLVECGESFSFAEDLRDFARISQSGVYVVQARLYMELYYPETAGIKAGAIQTANRINNGNASFIISNSLPLTVRPKADFGPDGTPVFLDVETNAVLVRERLAPDEVVNYTLTARQKEQWEKFFLYLDLEEMYKRDSFRRRQWLAESEEGRSRLLARYKSELQAAVVDGDIATIPRRFTIERTDYGNEEGTVTVLEYFDMGMFLERKRFTYYMRRIDGIWTIVDYVTVKLGTE
ncbi:MAG: hypothetical protein LBH43_17805 [Treponema sp.]|jgi:hypothetical protein|nr:hypothetical protein [Treponema sp.]